MSFPNIEWPLRPDGTEVPSHRRSRWAWEHGYPVFCASDWEPVMVDGRLVGRWMCGYCEQFSIDHQSPENGQTLATCQNCGHANRVNLD